MKHGERVSIGMGKSTRWFATVMKGVLIGTASVLLAGCQNSFRLKGTVAGLSDGDTLLLSRDINTGIPTDTMIVSEGAFEYKSETDSVVLALLYAPGNPELSTTLFLDPGTIEINLTAEAGKSTIGGTAANDALQEANYLSFRYGERMQELAQSLCISETDSMMVMLTKSQLEHLQHDLTEKIISLAERNIDNEFGYLIAVNLEDESFTPERRLRLIEQMPKSFRQRAEVKAIRKQEK